MLLPSGHPDLPFSLTPCSGCLESNFLNTPLNRYTSHTVYAVERDGSSTHPASPQAETRHVNGVFPYSSQPHMYARPVVQLLRLVCGCRRGKG